jgi:hypothetical protein
MSGLKESDILEYIEGLNEDTSEDIKDVMYEVGIDYEGDYNEY